MKLLVQFPTYKRADRFLEVFKDYCNLSSGDNEIFFNINGDSDDAETNSVEIKGRIGGIVMGNNVIVKKKDYLSYSINFDNNTTKISACNANIDKVKENFNFDVVMVASDDMIPLAQNWDKKISDAYNEVAETRDPQGCAYHFHDGNSGQLITISMLGRKLYEKFGYIYHPSYKALYCDNEFTDLAYGYSLDGKNYPPKFYCHYSNEVIIKHAHYSLPGNSNTGITDAATSKTLRYSYDDKLLYSMRKNAGFPTYIP